MKVCLGIASDVFPCIRHAAVNVVAHVIVSVT